MTKPYREEIPWNDPRSGDEFVDKVEKIHDQKMKDFVFRTHYPATVVSVGSGVASIKLLDGDSVIPNVKIKVRAGETLSEGDEVYILAINGSLNNIIIDFKK